MPIHKTKRVFAGLGAIVLTLTLGYVLIMAPIHRRWGATAAELRAPLAGDEALPRPLKLWTRAVTVNAAPEAIFPWVAQLGQGRGGFYSYDWLENVFGIDIHSADRILPEHQNPALGDPIPLFPGNDFVTLRSLEPNRSFVMQVMDPTGKLAWIWSINLQPIDATHTRLIIRNRMGDAGGPLMERVMFSVLEPVDVMMELKMLHGIQQRAEGRSAHPLTTPLEIGVWLGALLVGLAAGVRVLTRPNWRIPLAIGLAAVLLLQAYTFIYPPLYLRLGLTLALAAALLWESAPARRAVAFGQAAG